MNFSSTRNDNLVQINVQVINFHWISFQGTTEPKNSKIINFYKITWYNSTKTEHMLMCCGYMQVALLQKMHFPAFTTCFHGYGLLNPVSV